MGTLSSAGTLQRVVQQAAATAPASSTLAVPMAFDRTGEFKQIIEVRRSELAHLRTQQQQKQPQRSLQQATQLAHRPRQRSDFAAAASRIGNDIHLTAEKLAKLTRLAQSNSLLLFADPTEEINELAFIIKQDITTLNGKLAQLKASTAPASRGAAAQRAKHSTSVVEQLGMQLRDAMCSFQGVLQTRSENVRVMLDRRQKVGAPTSEGESACCSSSRCPSCAMHGNGVATPSKAPAAIFELTSPLGPSIFE